MVYSMVPEHKLMSTFKDSSHISEMNDYFKAQSVLFLQSQMSIVSERIPSG